MQESGANAAGSQLWPLASGPANVRPKVPSTGCRESSGANRARLLVVLTAQSCSPLSGGRIRRKTTHTHTCGTQAGRRPGARASERASEQKNEQNEASARQQSFGQLTLGESRERFQPGTHKNLLRFRGTAERLVVRGQQWPMAAGRDYCCCCCWCDYYDDRYCWRNCVRAVLMRRQESACKFPSRLARLTAATARVRAQWSAWAPP